MQDEKSSLVSLGTVILMLLLIFDAKTALTGAAEGIELCMHTVIPSLFPFFFLSGIFQSFLAGKSSALLRLLGKLCAIPAGAEPLLLIGLTGGYPVGAQCISDAFQSGVIKKEDAQRMLGFCNNSGPAFIFGMTGLMFPTAAAPWVLWLIQLLCALITGILLPSKTSNKSNRIVSSHITAAQSMHSAIKAMAAVCGWVIVFRVLIRILDRWLLWMIPAEYSAALLGILELSNGCIALNVIQNTSVRFVIAAAITVFGGLCVFLQTISVSQGLSCKIFFVGKLIQTAISFPLSMTAANILFPGNIPVIITGTISAVCLLSVIIITVKIKKYTGNSVFNRV